MRIFKIRDMKYRTGPILICFLAGLILSITSATQSIADNGNIFAKGWQKMTKNNEEHQIIRLVDEKHVDEHITAVAWSPDGKSIASVGVLPTSVTIWDSASLSVRHKLHQGDRGGGEDNITFSPDSQYLASGLKTVNLWKVADGTLLKTFIAPHITPDKPQYVTIEALRFSPDGKTLVVVYSGKKQIVIAYGVADGKIVWTYEPQKIMEPEIKGGGPLLTTPVSFAPDGNRIILGTFELGSDNINKKRLTRILLLNATSGKLLNSIDDIHVMAPTALALSLDGKWVVTGTSTGDKDQTLNLKTHQVVTVDNKDPVRIWSLETGKLVKELPVQSKVQSLVFSRDGKYLFGAKNDYDNHLTLAVWNIQSGMMIQEVKNNPGPMSLAISPDGRRLAAACQNKLSIYEITASNE